MIIGGFMRKKVSLDEFEQEIENNLESMQPIPDMEAEITLLKKAAKRYMKTKKLVTIRIHEADLEAMQIKASKLGIPYQTYINMVLHKDAITGW